MSGLFDEYERLSKGAPNLAHPQIYDSCLSQFDLSVRVGIPGPNGLEIEQYPAVMVGRQRKGIE